MRRSSSWLGAYAVIAAVHLVTIGVGDPWAAGISKVLLMPVLAVWLCSGRIWAMRVPRWPPTRCC